MPLRRRLAIVAAGAVAVAVVLVAVVSYLLARHQLRGSVDAELRAQASEVQTIGFHAITDTLPGLSANLGGPAPYAQIVAEDGTRRPFGHLALPVDATTRAIATKPGSMAFTDVWVGGAHLRQVAVGAPQEVLVGDQTETAAVQFARPLGPVDRVLSHLRVYLGLLVILGIALAAALGRLAVRRALRPLAEVAASAEHVSETEDLSTRIHVHSADEVGQLARRFNAMIERLQHSRDQLDESVRAQRQLVADASHELRTPVTSLRTNVEVLLAGGELDAELRHQMLDDVVEQTEELSALVNDLIEVARGDLPLDESEELRLDRVVEEAVARARRNAPETRFVTDLSPVIVHGVPERLARAIGNLLDNAARHSPRGGEVSVTVDTEGVRVRDHGTGFEPGDVPYVFDRFFRGINARGRQGSGLGLAIVRQVAEQHGGSVAAANAPGGGALMTFALPGAPLHTADEATAPVAPEPLTPPEAPAPAPGARR
jgi:two-component system sensor histidine kinase MprB